MDHSDRERGTNWRCPDWEVARCDWCGRNSAEYILDALDPPVQVCGVCYHGRGGDRRKVILVAIESIFCFFRQRSPCPMVCTLKPVVARVASYL
jgi:hypothetical protein